MELIRENTEWKIYMFSSGVFWANCSDGRLSFGKCNPVTKEILQWHEYS